MENPQAQASVAYIVLGSLLALITSVILEILKIWMNSKSDTRNFKIILRAELGNVVGTIDRLIDDYARKQFYAFAVLAELKEKISRIENLREKIVLIRNYTKREEILSLINEVYIFYSDTNILENMAFNKLPNENEGNPPWNTDIFKSQRQMVAIKSVDLKRKLQNLIFYLESK